MNSCVSILSLLRASALVWGLAAAGAGLAASAIPAFAAPAPEVAPEADRTLKAMSDYLGDLRSFSVKYDIDVEIVSTDAQKLQFSSSGELEVRRPDRLHVVRDTGFSRGELFADGKTVALFSPTKNGYLQVDAAGTIEKVMDQLRTAYGLDVAAADLLDARPYASLIRGLKAGAYHGKAMVGGVECHHLAFRTDEVDWQIWIRVGEKPLPIKYVITTKWMTAAPQYAIQFRDWAENGDAPDGRFQFTPPAGAVRWKSIIVNELGEAAAGEP